jgi:hypothetical protein
MAKRLPPDVLDYFRKQGAKGGKIGGKMALETMTAAERRARAKKAGEASAVARKARAKRATG